MFSIVQLRISKSIQKPFGILEFPVPFPTVQLVRNNHCGQIQRPKTSEPQTQCGVLWSALEGMSKRQFLMVVDGMRLTSIMGSMTSCREKTSHLPAIAIEKYADGFGCYCKNSLCQSVPDISWRINFLSTPLVLLTALESLMHPGL